ncbi:GDSL-type esterase/lipase family protein [Sutcliffiella sp. NPDC057660]|uniref:SGNH/GDSL hydrolase family protein n=1 Tax=Sutcliffiella sp. NPDC057660 TaxID=3346199 RepID=UPI0036AFF887
MKTNGFSLLFAILLVFNIFASSSVFAEGNSEEPPTIVALGDSIPYGYNLTGDNSVPSSLAFPNLIAAGYPNVHNLSKPGLTSDVLLAGLNEQVLMTLESADLITLNIGSNDLLQAVEFSKILASGVPIDEAKKLELMQKATVAAQKLGDNLGVILQTIRQQTDAPIFLYNIYNPFAASQDPFAGSIHIFGETISKTVNQMVINPMLAIPETYIIDSYSAFSGNQMNLVIPGDIHPNQDGHKVLAGLADQQLAILYPEEEVPSLEAELFVSDEEETEGPVEVFIETNKNDSVTALKWLKGSDLTKENFISEGNEISLETFSFEIVENGTYTVYVESYEEFILLKFTIENIKAPPVEEEEPPVEEEEPPVEEEQPPVEEEKPPVKEEPKEEKPPVKEETKKPSNGNKLPNTATNSYNYLVMGSGMLVVGFSVMLTSRVRSRKVNK